MHIGIGTSAADIGVDVATMARMVEDAGIESLFLGEHSHIPAGRGTPYPGGDGTMPPGYERLLDLFVALSLAAAATTNIKLGTGICQVVQRDPIHTAKAVASVDRVSGGRMLLVMGSSWNVEEMRNHGTDPGTRYELLEERVLAMREIWAQDEASFHGRFVDFERIWSWPKPVQDPMPIWVGGNSPGSEQRALRVGTGWSPIDMPGVPERVRAYHARAAAEGIATSVIVFGGGLSPSLIEEYARAGVERCVHAIGIQRSVADLEREIERLLAARAEFAGAP